MIYEYIYMLCAHQQKASKRHWLTDYCRTQNSDSRLESTLDRRGEVFEYM